MPRGTSANLARSSTFHDFLQGFRRSLCASSTRSTTPSLAAAARCRLRHSHPGHVEVPPADPPKSSFTASLVGLGLAQHTAEPRPGAIDQEPRRMARHVLLRASDDLLNTNLGWHQGAAPCTPRGASCRASCGCPRGPEDLHSKSFKVKLRSSGDHVVHHLVPSQ